MTLLERIKQVTQDHTRPSPSSEVEVVHREPGPAPVKKTGRRLSVSLDHSRVASVVYITITEN
jgi:hypothetical protein